MDNYKVKYMILKAEIDYNVLRGEMISKLLSEQISVTEYLEADHKLIIEKNKRISKLENLLEDGKH